MPLRLLLRMTFSQQATQARADADAGRTAPNAQQQTCNSAAVATLQTACGGLQRFAAVPRAASLGGYRPPGPPN
eukprot:6980180-Alexandrium_andersonii.AAC.1